MSASKIVKINVTFRNIEATDPIKTYAEEKLSNTLKKFIHHDTEAHVVLSVEKNRQIAEVSMHTGKVDVHAKEETDDMYASIDALSNTVSGQLRKHKERLTQHH